MILFEITQVPVASWFDDMSDTELLDLIPYMDKLSTSKDIYAFLRQNPHPLSCKRETAGGLSENNSILPVPSTSNTTNVIASVEKPGTGTGTRRLASPAKSEAGDTENSVQLAKAAGRLSVQDSSTSAPVLSGRYESASSGSGFSKSVDCAGCISGPSNDYSFNSMVSNGNGASGPGGDVLLYNPAVKTP